MRRRRPGYLHLGHVFNAICVWGAARARGGRVLLRIEDHDRQRCRVEFETAILDNLEWLGFLPDEEHGVWRGKAGARNRFTKTRSDGCAPHLAYACDCTRA